MKKYAFMLMGAGYKPSEHTASFVVEENETRIVTVRDKQEAKTCICRLHEEGFGAIELCGAFSANFADELAELTQNQVAIGYTTHSPALNPLFAKFFGE